MKITIEKSLIENALVKAIPFLDLKDGSKVQSNVQLNALGDTLTISATDYDMGLITTLNGVMCIQDGTALANGKKLLDIIKILKNGMIEIESKNDVLHITQGKSKFKTPTMDELFPKFPNANDKMTLDFADISESLRKILPTVDTNNPKYELNGALMEIGESDISFASTDTKRLSFASIESGNELSHKMIIPKNAIVEMQKLFLDDVEMFCSADTLIIKSDRYHFFTKLINGKYPDFKRVIPQSLRHILEINKLAMIENIKQVAAISNDITISFDDNNVSLQSLSGDKNEAKTEFEIDSAIQNPITLAINSKYVLDFLNTIYSDKFTIGINEPNMPIVLEADGLKTIVMPIVS